jgi:hypothetical protein
MWWVWLVAVGQAAPLSELMHERVALTLRGQFSVSPALDAQLRVEVADEIHRYGEPIETTDWAHLYSAAGGDLPALLQGLDLASDARWTYIVEEDQLLREGELVDALPLLGSSSEVVRRRAAERFESVPDETRAALERAYRYAPGRAAPLRGDIAVPELPWDEVDGDRWARRLTRWARRCSRQHDDRALRATLRLLTEPSLSTALPDSTRQWSAAQLFELAGPDVPSQRESDVLQAMDALLRQVPFEEGLRPAPDEVETGTGPTWVRQTPAL